MLHVPPLAMASAGLLQPLRAGELECSLTKTAVCLPAPTPAPASLGSHAAANVAWIQATAPDGRPYGLPLTPLPRALLRCIPPLPLNEHKANICGMPRRLLAPNPRTRAFAHPYGCMAAWLQILVQPGDPRNALE